MMERCGGCLFEWPRDSADRDWSEWVSDETQRAVAEARARLFAKARARDYGYGPIPPRYDGPNTWTRLVNAYEAAVRADAQEGRSSGFDEGFDAGFGE